MKVKFKRSTNLFLQEQIPIYSIGMIDDDFLPNTLNE